MSAPATGQAIVTQAGADPSLAMHRSPDPPKSHASTHAPSSRRATTQPRTASVRRHTSSTLRRIGGRNPVEQALAASAATAAIHMTSAVLAAASSDGGDELGRVRPRSMAMPIAITRPPKGTVRRATPTSDRDDRVSSVMASADITAKVATGRVAPIGRSGRCVRVAQPPRREELLLPRPKGASLRLRPG